MPHDRSRLAAFKEGIDAAKLQRRCRLGGEVLWFARSGCCRGNESGRGSEAIAAGTRQRRAACSGKTRSQSPPEDVRQAGRENAPRKSSPKPVAKTPAEEKISVEAAAALRVPFGRGPKDRAFREERAEKE